MPGAPGRCGAGAVARPTTETTEASTPALATNPATYPATYRTSKLEPDYRSYLRNLVEEEPARSTEMVEPGTALSRYSVAGYPGYYPRPREPYPYKHLRMPLPYLAPPRHRAPARDRADNGEFDREDMMGNKMDSTQHIEGYIDSDETEYPANVYAAHVPPRGAQPRPCAVRPQAAPACHAAEPHHAAARARARQHAGLHRVRHCGCCGHCHRASRQQSPAPARTSDRLLVDVTEGEAGARNVSVEDFLFLYNITFLTDSREIQPCSGARPILDHNLAPTPDTEEYDESVFDYSSVPDYRDLDSEERFNEALEELLGDYEDYSQEQGSNAEQEVEILSEIIGKTVNEPSLN